MYRVLKPVKPFSPSHVLAPPNYRRYRLVSEEDGIQCHSLNIADFTADVCYSVSHGGRGKRVAIGEFKRGLIRAEQWQNGRLTSPQKRRERESSEHIHIYTYVLPPGLR
ncbi:hypothetical protein B0J13DRAFT_566643 [Dactylonectria estremocensis]|uniref:Uncharacterized protein n=1 Tax=Dactylonectria estremocensis TaxID=1079267 RepID=A0A9P9IK38_9HYPO|nr:hypothetical protein B0J13DRAFT_566643 [Dactylonectria estremocensis]